MANSHCLALYQTLQELRHMLLYVYERAFASATEGERDGVRVESFSAYGLVKVQVLWDSLSFL